MVKPILFVSAILVAMLSCSKGNMSLEEKVKIYSVFATLSTIEDESTEDTLCFDETLHPSLCPADEAISCGPIKDIMKFCEDQVGTTDSVALKGCMNYVGYFIIEEDHLACCPSAVCEEWLDEMIESMDIEELEGYEEVVDANVTDDHEVDEDEDEDDEDHDEF